MQLDFNELRELLTAIGQTDIAELTLKSGEWELTVRKSPSGLAASPAVAPHPDGNEGIAAYTAASLPVAPPAPRDAATTPAASAEVSAPSVAPPAIEAKYETIASPMVGTFYRSVAPGEPPFVEVGDRIKNGQTVCIIEAFKVMNELEAELSGEIVEILVENGQAVEFGQPLMRVKP
ncbi:MAG TPA: acetyl-CoA carboxylase biotin carboxyl carrier protein [Oscillatoriales cyanobacterium M59_W2019_021]|nr:acetyl-CoA carboxylase biotin carboxyl carrier protein [Oscillatoriales cyanobacterium M59_W2019_021]